LKGIEEATEVDIANKIIEFVEVGVAASRKRRRLGQEQPKPGEPV
jgi:hypothetical protein